MKETPIIMSGNHPKLILDGLKSMTRRVIKRQLPELDELRQYWGSLANKTDNELRQIRNDVWLDKCPYGQVGDRLWVRETLDIGLVSLGYRAGQGQVNKYTVALHKDWFLAQKLTYVPSIFMPRWASRILLEITKVRVERLQEISNEDAKAEGVTPMTCCLPGAAHYITPFKELWDSLNAKRGYGWETNPWVWVINFKEGNNAIG